jgi:transcriptional regulator with AAA-type ATPase domain
MTNMVVTMAQTDLQELLFLLTMPDHLRETMMVLETYSIVTAEEVAKVTGRARAVESCYLNQLVNQTIIWKERKGRAVYFHFDHARTEIAELFNRIRKLNTSIRRIILEDMLMALHNRITVFEKVKI